jgi:hypothetical protein
MFIVLVTSCLFFTPAYIGLLFVSSFSSEFATGSMSSMTSPSSAQDALKYLILCLHTSRNRLDISKSDHEYFRRPPRLGAGPNKRRTKKIADRNHSYNSLHTIPEWLLLCIGDHLDRPDLICFQSSCQQMRRDLLPAIQQHQPAITRGDRFVLLARLYIWRYAKMMEVERSWPTTERRPTTALRGFCPQSHPIRALMQLI